MAAGFTFFLSSNNTSSEPTSLLSSDIDNSNSSLLTATSLFNFDDSQNASGIDAFGGKDLFGTPDFSAVNSNLFANASNAETVGSVAFNSAETVGSMACASVGGDFGGGACASVGGGDCGGSSGGGFIC